MKKLIALLSLLALPAFGATVALKWDNPTTNVDGTPVSVTVIVAIN